MQPATIVKDELTRFDKMKKKPKILVLCSGGMDSVTLLAWAKERYGLMNVNSLFIDYGQTALMEESYAALSAANEMGIIYYRVSINVSDFMKSQIIGDDVETRDPKSTYVPARNMFFISIATAFAISNKIDEVAIGVHHDDDGVLYPDTTHSFISPMVAACIQYGVALRAPFIGWTKKDIIKYGMTRGVDYDETSSCYWPKKGSLPCGECPSCVLRQKGFDEYEGQKDRS